MCLILFSYQTHPDYRLVLAANRDEFYDRPTAAMAYWTDHPDVLAGRDLRGNGTWLGVTGSGRIAAITNYRDPAAHMQKAPSRGILISDYLTGNSSPLRYLEVVRQIGQRYNGFNIIAGDTGRLYYYSNRAERVREVKPGIYGISNHLMDTAWPKVQRGKALLQGQLNGREKMDIEKMFKTLSDRSRPADEELPDTGVGLQKERVLSPLFICSPDYGTRSSSIVLIDTSSRITMMERTFVKTAHEIKTGETRQYKLKRCIYNHKGHAET